MKPTAACIFVVSVLMIFASLVRFHVFAMPPGGSKMLVVHVSIGPYQWPGRSPSYHEVLTPVQLLLPLQNHHHHTQAAMTTTPQTSLAMDQEKQVQSIRDQLKGHSLPDGGEIVGSINSSSSEFNATNNRAHIVRQYESGSTASDRKTTRETPDRKEITFSLFSLEDLRVRQYFVRELIKAVSVGILFAIFLFCSKVSLRLLVRSSTQTSASQQVEIVERIPVWAVSFADPAVAIEFRNRPFSCGVPRRYRLQKRVPSPPPKLAKGKGRVILENLQQYFGRNRKDVAASLGVSVSTFKRMCRLQGITRWRNRMGSSGHVSKPPDQHGERNTSTAREKSSHNVQTGMEVELFGQNEVANVFQRDFMGGPIALHTSTARETPSHNVQTRMEGEPGGQNQESNECRRDFMERQIALNTESGLIMVSRPPDQHEERNTSTACETPSHNAQTGMEGELFGQNEVANVFRRDFMGGPIALNTESGLIMVSRPPDQHGERNTSTACGTPSCNVETGMEVEPVGQNQEANVFRRDFTEGPTALNIENGLTIGSYSEWASQVNDQSTLSTPYQNHNALVFPQPQITSMLSENRGGSIDWTNSLASQAEPFSDRHISGSSNLAFPAWSDQAAPSQHAEGQSVQSTVYPDHNAVHRFPEGHVFEYINWNEHTNSLASQAEPFSDRLISRSIWRPPDQLEGQTMQFTAHTNPNAFGLPQFQISSSQVPSVNEDRRNSLASQVAPNQPVATIVTERQDMRSVKVKATYGDSIVKFQLPLTSGIKELMQEVSQTLDCELGSFNVDYKDEDGDWILMARDDNVSEYLQLLTSLGNQATKLKVRDKVPNTTNI